MDDEQNRETTHRVHAADARDQNALATDSVDLVVTSPPYPMVEMWDGLFSELEPDIESYLDAGKGDAAFEAMHGVLDSVWDELERVVAPGGIVCLNVGDATRTVDGQFQVYPNHTRITAAFERRGFDPMPDILWHKPTNSAAKFMGSGMVPPNAYVTLEHEHILVFRNGSRRAFEPGADRRYEAAYFWEERNRWFTDIWSDVRGRLQDLENDDLRDRAAAFPFEIPYRLCSMFSTYGDTVLDPFWGTGTTTLAAMVAGRNSVGYEQDPAFVEHFDDSVTDVPDMSREVVTERLADHVAFLADRNGSDTSPDYTSEYYDFPVMTSQEETLRLYVVDEVENSEHSPTEYRLSHVPADQTPVVDQIDLQTARNSD